MLWNRIGGRGPFPVWEAWDLKPDRRMRPADISDRQPGGPGYTYNTACRSRTTTLMKG